MDPDDAGGESSDEGEREMVTETVSVTVRRQQQYQKKEGGEAETDRETAAEAQETAGARDQVEEDADLRDLLHHIGRLDDSDCGDLLDHFDQEETKLATDFSGGGSQQGLNQFGRLKNRFRNLRLGQKQKLVQLQTFDTTCEDEEEEDFEVTILSTCDLMTSTCFAVYFLTYLFFQSYGSPAEDLDDYEFSEEAFSEDLDHRSREILGQERQRRRPSGSRRQGLYVEEPGQTEQDTLVILRGGRIRRIMDGFKGIGLVWLGLRI